MAAEAELGVGQSIALPPRMYPKFYGQEGRGTVLVGEVSRVNDDKGDNRFFRDLPRSPPIENDGLPTRLLWNEYASVDRIVREAELAQRRIQG